MDMGRFLIETHLRTGGRSRSWPGAHGVSASWLFKLLRATAARARRARAPVRRPKSSPSRIADLYEDEIVALRKELADAGFDAGAATIHFHLAERRRATPRRSRPSGGCSGPGALSPPSRTSGPKSSYIRFVADLPNECWQADITHCAPAERRGLRGPQRHRRPLEAVCGLQGHVRRHGPRRGPGPAQSGRDLGLSGLVPDRQRAHLHRRRPASASRGRRARALRPRHRRPSTRVPTIPRPAARSSASTRR